MKDQKSAVRWRDCLSALPAIVVALLPRLACPCQMPAYAGLIGSMGLAFLMKTVYLLPLTAMCLTFAVGGLAVGAKRRRGYAPFLVGLLGAVMLMVCKFFVTWNPAEFGMYAAYVGTAVLLAASVWNSWPPKIRKKLKFNADGTVDYADTP